MQPAHKTMHYDNLSFPREISRNNFSENDQKRMEYPALLLLKRDVSTFPGKVNFTILRIIFPPLLPFLSPRSHSLTRYPAISYSTIQRVQNSSHTFSISFRYEILPQVQWRFKERLLGAYWE